MAEVEQELRQGNRGGLHLDVPDEKLKLLRVKYTTIQSAELHKNGGNPRHRKQVFRSCTSLHTAPIP